MGRPKSAGLNDRYSDNRFGGYNGESSANVYPKTESVSYLVGFAAGVYDSADTVPPGARRELTVVQVITPFDGGATILVGTPAVANADVQAGEINITTAGNKQKARQYTQPPGGSVVRTTIGGAPTVGSARVTVFYTV